MTKKLSIILFLSLLLLPHIAQSEGIPLQKDILLSTPIFGPEDLPEEITFTLYDSQTATTPLGYQTFQRGQYTADFEFSKSDGISGGNVARINAKFGNTLSLEDAEGKSILPKEIWLALAVGDTEIGERIKVSDETLVQILLASDASIASYLTLVYEGDDNPITTIYKDLPISSMASGGSGSFLNNYFGVVARGSAEGGIIEPNNTDQPYWDRNAPDIYYNDGNVGIGITSPGANLHIADADTTGSYIDILKLGAGGRAYAYRFRHYGGLTAETDRLELWNHGAQQIATFRADGNVGIGTASPGANLHIADADTTGSYIDILRLGAGGRAYAYRFRHYGGLTAETDRLELWNHGAQQIATFRANGNVGIGTTNPTYKLSVNGTIRAKEIIVDSGWSDFVFEETYVLPPLDEVEKYIYANKHLPGIPSETEVKENGVTLGIVSSKLLQKIEELTLYVINQKKENDSLKARLAAIEKRISSKAQ
jgi:hypothetical protein